MINDDNSCNPDHSICLHDQCRKPDAIERRFSLPIVRPIWILWSSDVPNERSLLNFRHFQVWKDTPEVERHAKEESPAARLFSKKPPILCGESCRSSCRHRFGIRHWFRTNQRQVSSPSNHRKAAASFLHQNVIPINSFGAVRNFSSYTDNAGDTSLLSQSIPQSPCCLLSGA